MAKKPDRRRSTDYEVGFGKPPREYQFQKGHSGNRSGRPKKAESYDAMLCRIINHKIPVTDNGKRRRISKIEAYLTQLVHKAMAGHLPEGRELIKLMSLFKPRPETDDDGRFTLVIEGSKQDPGGDPCD